MSKTNLPNNGDPRTARHWPARGRTGEREPPRVPSAESLTRAGARRQGRREVFTQACDGPRSRDGKAAGKKAAAHSAPERRGPNRPTGPEQSEILFPTLRVMNPRRGGKGSGVSAAPFTPGQAAVSLPILTAGAAANRGRAGLDGSTGQFFKEQGRPYRRGRGLAETPGLHGGLG